MNSHPVNYSPLPAARFAGFPARNCATGFLLSVPDVRSQRRLHDSLFLFLYAEDCGWIHSSLTLAVGRIGLNQTGDVNSIVLAANGV